MVSPILNLNLKESVSVKLNSTVLSSCWFVRTSGSLGLSAPVPGVPAVKSGLEGPNGGCGHHACRGVFSIGELIISSVEAETV